MRRAVSILTLGFLLGAVMMAAWPSAAGNGDAIYLGQKNTARRITSIKIKNGLVIESTKAGSPAAIFKSVGGPPFSVNSPWKVNNLNADMVDYLHGYELQAMDEWWYSTDIDDDENWSNEVKTIYAPIGGTLLMSGSVDFTNNKATADWVSCYFIVDGVDLAWTHMTTYVEPGETGICHSTGVFSFINSGTWTVQFKTSGMAPSDIAGDQGTWWVLYVPEPVL